MTTGTERLQCPHCNGRGRTAVMDPDGWGRDYVIRRCIWCDGTGRTLTGWLAHNAVLVSALLAAATVAAIVTAWPPL